MSRTSFPVGDFFFFFFLVFFFLPFSWTFFPGLWFKGTIYGFQVTIHLKIYHPKAEFKEFEPRLKYGWFHLKLYSMFQDYTGAQLKPVFGWFETRLKFIKFGLWLRFTHGWKRLILVRKTRLSPSFLPRKRSM